MLAKWHHKLVFISMLRLGIFWIVIFVDQFARYFISSNIPHCADLSPFIIIRWEFSWSSNNAEFSEFDMDNFRLRCIKKFKTECSPFNIIVYIDAEFCQISNVCFNDHFWSQVVSRQDVLVHRFSWKCFCSLLIIF